MEFIRRYQLDAMLVLIGVCGILAVMAMCTRTLSRKRRYALVTLELSGMLLLVFDRLAYLYRGDTGDLGMVMTRLSNFLVFLFPMIMLHAVNLYLIDLVETDCGHPRAPKQLVAGEVLFLAGVILLIISSFTGFYYILDEQNRYQRAGGFFVYYVAPVTMSVLQIITVIQNRKRFKKRLLGSIMLFTFIPYVATVLQIFFYGVSLTNLTIVGMAVFLYISALMDLVEEVENAHRMKIRYLQEEQQKLRDLFEETAEALVSSIDAKDRYTHGHSSRVAKYSERIARLAGMSDQECDEVYFAALLHDVGKIGIPDSIINKDGRLTDDEYAVMKRHPEIGGSILAKISQAPYLLNGACYHHERYDGKGYPRGLAGEQIPAAGRIISVADTYDTMTSRRSYRSPIPQAVAREELVKGMGTQFDPLYAKIMVRLIDQDEDYRMKDNGDLKELSMTKQLHLTEQGFTFSQGVQVTETSLYLRFRAKPDPGCTRKESMPLLLIYDSEDKLLHAPDEKGNTAKCTIYGELCFDGTTHGQEAREICTTHMEHFDVHDPGDGSDPVHEQSGLNEEFYEVEVVRNRDLVRVRMTGDHLKAEHIVALPYAACFAFVAIKGSHCLVDRIQVERDNSRTPPADIVRIVPELRFDGGEPGDLPNIQIDGYRRVTTEGIPLGDYLKLTFHTKSLPLARLVWHCPFVLLFSARRGNAGAEDFREFALIRFDGEECPASECAESETEVDKTEEFGDWEQWKARNREGLDCTVVLRRKDNEVTAVTEQAGLRIRTTTRITDGSKRIYVALTGDLVAMTGIRVQTEERG
ncbi:MAG: HD-GYP domain-containing protein [Lachnospiraceae bacterium]|nr:HD-GYP domain-containing protein [Lachnospiraceae bacterium]